MLGGPGLVVGTSLAQPEPITRIAARGDRGVDEQELRANSPAPRRLFKGLIVGPQVRDRWIPRDADTQFSVSIPT